MQNATIYSELGKRSPKYNQLQEIWSEQRHLFRWGPDERVLDAGCGPGDVTASVILSWLPADFQFLLGVDVSTSVIKHAITYKATKKVTFSVLDIGGDMSDFLRKEEISPRFNKIFSFYTLHWLHDLQRGVDNLFSLLRPGGQVLLLFPVDRLFQKTFKEVRSRDPWREYSKGICRKIPPFPRRGDPCGEFKEMLIRAGFDVVKCEVKNIPSKFDSVKDMKDLIESLDQDTDSIPIDLRTKFFNDCFEALEDMQAVKASNRGVIFTQATLLAVARKP